MSNFLDLIRITTIRVETIIERNEILQFLIEIRILVPHKVYVYTQIQPND